MLNLVGIGMAVDQCFLNTPLNYRLLLTVHSLLYKMKGRNQKDFMTTLRDLMHPKKRLHSLMMCHSLGSFFVGIIGFLFPATFGWYVFAVLFVKILNPYNIQCLERFMYTAYRIFRLYQ